MYFLKSNLEFLGAVLASPTSKETPKKECKGLAAAARKASLGEQEADREVQGGNGRGCCRREEGTKEHAGLGKRKRKARWGKEGQAAASMSNVPKGKEQELLSDRRCDRRHQRVSLCPVSLTLYTVCCCLLASLSTATFTN